MNKSLSRRGSRAKRGFTLIEILIVIALIGGIFALAVVNFGNIFSGASADIEKTKINQSFDSALMQYRLNVGTYPSTEEGLQALVVAPEGKADRWKGPYVKDAKTLVDGYGKPYGYRNPGVKNTTKYDLWSYGPDQADGTDDDIGNW